MPVTHSCILIIIQFSNRLLSATKRFVSLDFMIEDLDAVHEVDEHLSINTSLGVAVCCHISSVTPLGFVYNALLHHLTDP